ncbi:hypothetical protein FQN52_005839 [Onygenales sp. PD_12]|nr:hypothetical protein FQN51_002905 [Onygenales sp. PD_10]KAK2789848.1 hypothetical protein FQN53_001211 [Emmonsiellopsis sp. PD_33]KAK2789876.1 hypothetical protein FQN52_005839 [Onygenales sp. PD_12]
MSVQPSDNGHPPKRSRVGERTTLACVGCKQKKLKCDGQSPKCQNCIRTNRDCLVEDPATGLHRPRDYLKLLEVRVAYLESLLQQVRPDIAQDHLAPNDARLESEQGTGSVFLAQDSPSPQQGRQLSSHAGESPHARQHQQQSLDPGVTPRLSMAPSEDQQADRLSSEVAQLCLSAAGRQPHYLGPASAVSFSRIVSATMGFASGSIGGPASSSQRSLSQFNGDSPESWPDTVHDTPKRIPSPSMGAKLSKTFFDNVHPQYPFLHRPTFKLWEEEFRSGTQSGDLDDVSDSSQFFVLMVYAIGSLALGRSHHSDAEMYYSMALDKISSLLSSNGLESIQCILSCAVYSIKSPIGVSLWKISGMAIRHCIDLGFHRSTTYYHRNADTLTKEMIKRCFWIAYDIDRVAAFILGRPVGIPEGCIDVELPSDIDDENITPSRLLKAPRAHNSESPTIMTGCLHVIRLRRIWAKISEELYMKSSPVDGTREATVEGLRRSLDDWRASLPCQLTFARSHPLSVFSSSEWFQLAYDHSILLLYRPYITSTVSQPGPFNDHQGLVSDGEQETIDRAFEECSVRAREICVLYRRLYQSSSIQFTWGSLHILFLGGLTYLYCLWRSKRVRELTKRTDVVSTCMACSTVLVIIAERWNLATSYRDLFEALSERTTSMVFGNGNLSRPSAERCSPQLRPDFDPALTTDVPSQDWIMNLNGMSIPQESEWLVQELLQGEPQYPLESFYNGEVGFPDDSTILQGAVPLQ